MKRFHNRIIPALRAFNPDLIFISAGFDATKNDVGNARHYPKFCCGMNLEPADFVEVTQSVLRVAGICCKDRVVSVLEGGYGRLARRGQRTGLKAAKPPDKDMTEEEAAAAAKAALMDPGAHAMQSQHEHEHASFVPCDARKNTTHTLAQRTLFVVFQCA